MRTRKLGDGGPDVSVVGLGCNNFGGRVDVAGTRAVVDAALDAGVTLLDTADSYGDGQSEEFLGEVLEGRRERVVLATKFGHSTGGASAPTTSTSTSTTGPTASRRSRRRSARSTSSSAPARSASSASRTTTRARQRRRTGSRASAAGRGR
jgi:aryl-alcohol dehydrogenase-like predicted oxidoreductase